MTFPVQFKTSRPTIWAACLLAGAAITAASPPAQSADGDSSSMTVTLLGTGTPVSLEHRFGPATLVEAGNLKLLFDVGRGAPIRISQAGLTLGEIDPKTGRSNWATTQFIPHASTSRPRSDCLLTFWSSRFECGGGPAKSAIL